MLNEDQRKQVAAVRNIMRERSLLAMDGFEGYVELSTVSKWVSLLDEALGPEPDDGGVVPMKGTVATHNGTPVVIIDRVSPEYVRVATDANQTNEYQQNVTPGDGMTGEVLTVKTAELEFQPA